MIIGEFILQVQGWFDIHKSINIINRINKINDNGTYTEAKEGTDYTVKSGSLGDKNLTIVPISRVAITGNYGGKITDPAKPSTAVTSSANSPKTGDVNVAYAIMVLLAAGALVFGAKRQLSK